MIFVDVAGIAPKAHLVYRTAFQKATALPETRLRLAHFLAQCCHETAGLTKLRESLNYTTADRLMAVWPKRFRTRAAAEPFVRSPRDLANLVYGGRMGNVGLDDGWRYIGRGLLQITGKDMYAQVGDAIGVDLVANPELVALEDHAVAAALAVWKIKDCDEHADVDDIAGVTRRINGGLHGLEDRREWLRRAKDELGLVEDAA